MEFSHVDKNEKINMVEVSHKIDSKRIAVAISKVYLPKEVLDAAGDNEIMAPKGPVFQTAVIAGIQGAKQTSNLIPLCHPLPLGAVNIQINLNDSYAEIRCEASCYGKTGVEMEALTGASVAALTIYDMCKALSHDIIIEQTQLHKKTGGKKDFERKDTP